MTEAQGTTLLAAVADMQQQSQAVGMLVAAAYLSLQVACVLLCVVVVVLWVRRS